MIKRKPKSEKPEQRSREQLQEIIKNAVAEKEDVITAFQGVKKNTENKAKSNVKCLLWNFLCGLAFGLGLLFMLLLAAWLLSNFNEVKSIFGIFGKMIEMLKALV